MTDLVIKLFGSHNSLLCVILFLSLNINIHVLLTVLHIFLMMLLREIGLTSETFCLL